MVPDLDSRDADPLNGDDSGLHQGPKRSLQSSILSACGISVDTNLFDAHAGDKSIRLTSREYDLLLLLLRESYRVMARLEIKRLVWGRATVSERVVDTYICRLRKKLREAGHPGISVLQRRGYRLLTPEC